MDAITKLRRYCYLGSFEPVYVHLRGNINVRKYWPEVSDLVIKISDHQFSLMINEVLLEKTLVRRDEPLFVYAAYLASSVDIKWKTAVRVLFPHLIKTDDDLFLFSKYADLIGKEQNRKIFSRTVRKAISAWYKEQNEGDLRKMWLSHRGLHGFTHKALIKLCHLSDEAICNKETVQPFFQTCAQIIKNDVDARAINSIAEHPPITSNAEEPTSNPVAISKLRTTKKKDLALRIIRKFNLPCTAVPGHLWRHRGIMEAILPTMSYLQILKWWRKMVRFNHFTVRNSKNVTKETRNLTLCQKQLENKDFASQCRIHPIHLLISLYHIANCELDKVPPKRAEALKLEYLTKLYKESFNWNIDCGKLRMHITVNLQTNYKRKFLKNHKNLKYYDACRALALGYLKRESVVDIFHWFEEKLNLKKITIERDCTMEDGFNAFDQVNNPRNNQRLITPIKCALGSEKEYDVFLCIVPTAGRGNPKQKSELLEKFLTKYRETKVKHAKFIILDLLKYKRSMTYSETHSDHILEICGLDEHTTDIIQNFIRKRFE